MRLINAETLELEEFMGSSDNIPHYAILSHTWDKEEVTFKAFSRRDKSKVIGSKGFEKIRMTCKLTLDHGLQYCWVDTCCIDKTSSAELTESINSMYQWYRDSRVTFVWLADLAVPEGLQKPTTKLLKPCRWFTRGWTLQELIAPRAISFYDSSWNKCGEKSTLGGKIPSITGIEVLLIKGEDLAGSLFSRPEDVMGCRTPDNTHRGQSLQLASESLT